MNNMGAEGGGNYCNGGGGGGGGSAVLQVKVKGKDRVAAVLPLQEHWLPLSNLDLLLPPLDVGVFFCYKNNADQADFVTVTAALKASLAQTLVTYYPFAGEVVTNSTGEPELLCNNRGVDFITAYADVDLRDLNLHNPDDTVDNKLIPNKMMIKGEEDNHGSVLCIQATALKCGGMVLACTFDHRISDAYSANMFLVAWAEIALNNVIAAANSSSSSSEERRKKPPAAAAAVAPTFRRSLLCPRRSGSHDTSALDRLYVPVSSMRPPAPSDHRPPSAAVLNRIYYVAAADIEKMQMEATADDRYNIGGRRKRSKLEAFSAYLWRLVAAAVAKKHEMRVCRMGIVVNGRYRMKPPELLANYFGNVLSIPYGTLGVQDLQMMGLSEVTDRVHEFMQDATTEEHFLGLIDWVEARRPEPAVARIYCNGRTTTAEGEEEEEEGIAFVVSSGRGFPVAELDFGWGRPVFGSYHFPWGDSAGYVMPMPSAKANGDWVVYMHLLDDVIEAVESDDIFCPLTPDYLLLDHHHHHHL